MPGQISKSIVVFQIIPHPVPLLVLFRWPTFPEYVRVRPGHSDVVLMQNLCMLLPKGGGLL